MTKLSVLVSALALVACGHGTGTSGPSRDAKYRDKVLIAGVSDKDEASKKLPGLSRVNAFPTTLFIDRQGRVRKMHTGISGPATGDHYTLFVGEVRATLDQLLAETT